MKSQSNHRIQEAKKILNGFTLTARRYWLAVLIQNGALLAVEAGYLVTYWEGLK